MAGVIWRVTSQVRLDGKFRRAEAEAPPAEAPRKPLSSSDMVVDAVIRGLRAGRYVPGQRLIEADLTQNLNISRGPVREALKRLAAEGVVVLTPHRGAYVRALSRREVIDTLSVLEALTGLMARLAAKRIDEGDNRARVEAALSGLLAFREQGDSIAFMDQRRRFYDTLIEIGGNLELKRIMPLIQIHLLRLQFQSYISARDRTRQFEEYGAFCAAILDGNPRLADRLMRLHIRRTRVSLGRLPEEAFASG